MPGSENHTASVGTAGTATPSTAQDAQDAAPTERRARSTSLATLLVVLSACGFGSISTLTLVATRAGVPLVPTMFWRYFVAAIVMIIAVAVNDVVHTPPRRALLLIVVGGIGQVLVSYLSLRALDFISVAPLAFLFYTYPAWVTLISAARGVDRITAPRAIALVLALVGVATIIGSPLHARLAPAGIALALAAAVTYGAYIPTLSALQRGLDPIASATLVIIGAAIMFGLFALATGTLHVAVPPRAALAIVALAIPSTVAAFWLFLAGLAALGPVRTAIVSTVEPFYTMLLGVIVLGDAFTWRTALGGALIAAAVITIQRSSARAAASG